MARILFGDDDCDLRRMFRTLLESAGHELVLAAEPSEVLDRMRDGPLDLLIVDLRFPKRDDGLRLIRRVRESGCETPILLLSGWPDDIYGCPEEQMVTRLISKPAPVPELLRAIDELTR